MPITFLIPSYLRPYAGGQSRVEVNTSSKTVEEALAGLWKSFPALRDRIITEQGEVRQYVNIFVGEGNIRDSAGLATPVRDGCEIMIVPSVAGGVAITVEAPTGG